MRERWLAMIFLLCTVAGLPACQAREEARPPAPTAVTTVSAVSATTEKPAPLTAATTLPAAATPPAALPASETTPITSPRPVVPPQTARTVPPRSPAVPPAAATSALITAPPTAAQTSPAPPVSASTAIPALTKPAGADVVDPGGVIAAPVSKAGLTNIGAEKCKLCHKVQHASWASSAHARRSPPLDCEGCHGPGSEYKAPAVMKDPAKAKAAGLVEPDAAFCARCHRGKIDPALFRNVHAHKAAP